MFKRVKYTKAPKIMKYVVVLTKSTEDVEDMIYKYCKTLAEAYAVRKSNTGPDVICQIFRMKYELKGSWVRVI